MNPEWFIGFTLIDIYTLHIHMHIYKYIYKYVYVYKYINVYVSKLWKTKP